VESDNAGSDTDIDYVDIIREFVVTAIGESNKKLGSVLLELSHGMAEQESKDRRIWRLEEAVDRTIGKGRARER
jgi:hypothetical protein